MTSVPTSAPQATTPARRQIGYVFGVTAAIASAILFSTKGIAIKLAYAKGVDSETLMAFRMGLSLPFYAIVGLISASRSTRTIARADWPKLLLQASAVGILGYWVASYTDFLGLQHISAGLERLILFTYPFFVVLFGWAFFGGRLGPIVFLCLGTSYAGLMLVMSQHSLEPGESLTAGVFWVMCSSVSFAFYQLLAKGVIGRLGAQLFTSVAMSAAAILALAWFLAVRPVSTLAIFPDVWPEAVFLAIGSTIVPSYLLSMALARISAQLNASIAMISPVATIIMAAVILGDHMNAAEWAGTTLVIGGVALHAMRDSLRARGAPGKAT